MTDRVLAAALLSLTVLNSHAIAYLDRSQLDNTVKAIRVD